MTVILSDERSDVSDSATVPGQATVDPEPTRPLKIVGIGASAGGLEALEQFFKAMPPQTGLAFVVVQHLSPDFRSLMDELLAHRTSIPIYRVEDGMRVKRDAIYLIPPKKEMIISGGQLLLTDKDPSQGLTLPIDLFFRSLAQDVGREAIGIVLSGTGSDGSRGIRDIHEAGGLVMAQSLDSSKFDGMPKSAIDTGLVDLILPPQEMPAALLRHLSHPLADAVGASGEATTVVEGTMERFFHLLRDECGIDFSYYKPTTVRRRIERRLQMSRIDDFEDYVELLGRDPGELNSLYKDLLIGVTNFFRDREAFERLRRDVLPGILSKHAVGDEFRVWVAGCATGEEAYSLAILLNEQMEALHKRIDVKVFATDVHRASIELASAGLYPGEALTGMEPELIERYFVRKGSAFQVTQDLRQMIVFANHNILKDAPFTKLDLIACRNLLIYLLPQAQKKVLSLFHFGLKTGGILFLGPSETPAELGDEFDTLDSHWKIYRKRRDVRLPHDLRLPMPVGPTAHLRPGASGGSYSSRASDGELNGVYDLLLAEFMPPSLLLNEQRELVHTFGGAEKFLKVKAGKTSTNILDLVDSDLRIALSGALNRAAKERSAVQYKGVQTSAADGQVRLRIDVRPIPNRRTGSMLTLINLHQEQLPSPAPDPDQPRDIDIDEATRERVEMLERELNYTRESLQATVEELETSNEELQATNEELVASNEELQSTNEELHSVNEELYTVNAEYQRKIHELQQLNSDMDNLLRSTEIGTIFLDRDLCIRKFTPQIGRAFRLLPQDIGRPIDTFTHNIREPELLREIATVLQTGEPVEREVQDRDGIWYFLRILPYRSTGPQVEGAVLTLIDISVLKRTREELKERRRQLQGILDNSPTFLYVKDLEGRYQLCNRVSKRVLGAAPQEVCGKTDFDFLPRDTAEQIQSHDKQAAAAGKALEFEETLPQPDGKERVYLSVKFPLDDEARHPCAIGAVCTDITQLKHSEQQQRLAVVRRDQFLAMLSHELRNPLSAIVTASQVLELEEMSEPLREVRQIIVRQSQHMSRLLDDLLDVSRVTQDKIEMRKEVVDLRETARDAVQAVRSRFQARGQQLEVSLPEKPLFVLGDPARLQQVQVNLLSNASKYSPENGQVRLSLEQEASEAVIRVKDNGLGISPQMCESIFDLFVQCSDAKDRSDGGLGLGLTLARSIVEKHDGRIGVKSEGAGQGSEFFVRLPIASDRSAASGGAAPGSDVSARGADGSCELPGTDGRGHRRSPTGSRLLIIEDNRDARETLKTLLERHGYRDVLTAADGESGLQAVQRYSPDVALVDIGLPELDGYEVARRIRQSRGNSSIFLVALTGYGQSSDREAALAAGFDAHLVKPVKFDSLMALLGRQADGLSSRPVH